MLVGRSGWFSCPDQLRPLAGRPVRAQDTGLQQSVTGRRSVIGFSTLMEAEAGIREVKTTSAARESRARDREAYFDSDKVLNACWRLLWVKNVS